MAASDEFREHLKAGKIVEALNLALGEAVELEITTWVSTEKSNSSDRDIPQPGDYMRTRMNIVDGEVENEVGTQFIGNGPYRELREFHLAQVQGGQQIIQKNIESLQQVFSILLATRSRLPQSSPSPRALSPSPSDNPS